MIYLLANQKQSKIGKRQLALYVLNNIQLKYLFGELTLFTGYFSIKNLYHLRNNHPYL